MILYIYIYIYMYGTNKVSSPIEIIAYSNIISQVNGIKRRKARNFSLLLQLLKIFLSIMLAYSNYFQIFIFHPGPQ